jgi:RimJ/RimL family protein N-acetyltransferase
MTDVEIVSGGPALAEVRALFQEYAQSLNVDLSFQDFERELESLPGDYVAPGGALLLHRIGSDAAGCIAVHRWDERTAEMKRLYVRPAQRGSGCGSLLVNEAIAWARRAGYARMVLDTLPSMADAQRLYARLGFREIEPYRFNPVPGSKFLALRLPECVVLETERLRLRELGPADADFILELLNGPSFLRFVGDRGVRTKADAERYIRTGPMASYARLGFGLYCVERKQDARPLGICGILKRDSLEHPDLGFALLPPSWSNGYAFEAAASAMAHARRSGLTRVLAITKPDNRASIRLLSKLGFRFERRLRLAGEGPELEVFAHGELARPASASASS